jgi:hypothetical protein
LRATRGAGRPEARPGRSARHSARPPERTDKCAYIIADNKLAENAGWDEKLLRAELKDLLDDDFDLIVTGFSEDELKALLDESGDPLEGETDAEEAPPVAEEAVSRIGDCLDPGVAMVTWRPRDWPSPKCPVSERNGTVPEPPVGKLRLSILEGCYNPLLICTVGQISREDLITVITGRGRPWLHAFSGKNRPR